MAETTKAPQEQRSGDHGFVKGVHGVRYQVKDVARSVAFYTTHLGFTLKHQQLPAFGNVTLGDVDIAAQRTSSVGVSADAEWRAAGTWRLESDCASRQRSPRVRRESAKSGRTLSERVGDRAGWANPDRGSRRQSHRVVRAKAVAVCPVVRRLGRRLADGTRCVITASHVLGGPEFDDMGSLAL